MKKNEPENGPAWLTWPQAVAWIATDGHWAGAATHPTFYRPLRLDPDTGQSFAVDAPFVMAPAEAEARLIAALALGQLSALAVAGPEYPADPTGEPRQIPTEAWSFTPASRQGLRISDSGVDLLWLSPKHCYWRPRLNILELLRLWPGPLKKSTQKIRVTVAEEHRLSAWLSTQMRQAPNSPRTKSKMRLEARNAGFTFSSRGFERAWATAKSTADAPAWGASGRPKSKRKIETPD